MEFPNCTMSQCNQVVEVVHPYESETTLRGHVVNLTPGEKFRLISTVHDPWLYCAREFDHHDGFYLPITHVKVIDVDRVSSFRSDDESKKRRSELLVGVLEGEGGSLRKRSPGFKLADPQRISRSIPGDLNFVHNIADLTAAQQALERIHIHGDESLPDAMMAVPRTQLNGRDSVMETNVDEGISSSIDSSLMNQSTNYSSMGSSYAHDSSTDDVLGDKSPYMNHTSRVIVNNHVENKNSRENSVEHEDVRYENMYSAASLCRDRAPLPAPTDQPIRHLHGDWAEYKDAVGRTYFHHTLSQYSQWKPPRSLVSAKEVSVLSSSCETDDSISVDLDNDDDPDALSKGFDNGDVVYGPPSQCAPSLPKPPSPSLPKPPSPCLPLPSSPPVPPEKPAHFSFDSTNAKCNSLTRSLTLTNKAYNMQSNKRNSDLEYSESSLKILQSRNQDHEQSSDERMRNSSLANCEQNNLKTGMLWKCKYVEAGRRIKKQWVSCFVYLTNAHLIFYKDKKSSERKGPHFDAPLGVCDLRGADVDWSEKERAKRRHVIQLQLIDETVYLFHLDNSPEINSWFHLIQEVISQLPRPERYPAPPHFEQQPMRKHSKKEVRSHVRHRSDAGIDPERPGSTRRDSWIKKKPVTTGQPAAVGVVVESHSTEQIARGTIMEKLRKFFKHRPTVDQLKEKGIYKAEPVFGSNLIDICKREKTTVPRFITEVTKLIEERGLEVDGLYRVCGNLSQVQKLRCQVDQDKYTLLESEGDMSVLAGTLKLFFRELQEPVFPNNMTKAFLDSIKIQNPKQRLKSFQENLTRLPEAHHDTLRHLLLHLTRVTEHAQKNRMQGHNIAIVFGPTLFCTGGEGAKRMDPKAKKKGSKGAVLNVVNDPVQSNSHMAFNMIMQGQIVEYMLKEFTKLFPSESPHMVR